MTTDMSESPGLIDSRDYWLMEEAKKSPPKRLYEVLIGNLPLYACMGDVFVLCQDFNAFVVHMDFEHNDRDPRYPPFAVVHVASENKAKKLVEELNGLCFNGKRIYAEAIYGRQDLIQPRRAVL